MDNQPPLTPQTPPPTPPEIPDQQSQQQATVPAAAPTKTLPTLGFVGLGLAVLGTILAFIPAILIIGVIVLFVAFIISLVAVFKKNTIKWPSIAGLILSIIAGTLGGILFVVAFAVALADRVNEQLPSNTPSTSEQSNNSSDDSTSGKRPSIEEIGQKLKVIYDSEGFTAYQRVDNFYPCMGKELFNSDISDQTLQTIIDGGEPSDAEYDMAGEITQQAILTCDPDAEGIQ